MEKAPDSTSDHHKAQDSNNVREDNGAHCQPPSFPEYAGPAYLGRPNRAAPVALRCSGLQRAARQRSRRLRRLVFFGWSFGASLRARHHQWRLSGAHFAKRQRFSEPSTATTESWNLRESGCGNYRPTCDRGCLIEPLASPLVRYFEVPATSPKAAQRALKYPQGPDFAGPEI